MHRIVVAVLTFAAVLAPLASAEALEQMLLKPPKGFKVVAESKTDTTSTAVMVPDGQSVANWTEKLTTQVLFKQAEQSPSAYRTRSEKAAAAECPGATFETIKDGTENLYPMVAWTETCPKAKDGGKPEITWSKAVRGRENFYLLQKAHRFEPDAKQRKALVRLFDASRVCDTRVPGHRCKQK
ncbi:conserved hypothetical protein [Rhodopseudomonas palustris HaA2]|uniref:Uncharacterized protein n=1 Tax=Rhodopseudomonas palustris (strain HaA2) TaxID=316058 RepID=Q2IXL0_RHOP2|nr:hypothetical protein [Rhodopseudomonas palustris]ABD07050.1 conserved hypothetical protein [Rhodopseudomonas palustris HaA2]